MKLSFVAALASGLMLVCGPVFAQDAVAPPAPVEQPAAPAAEPVAAPLPDVVPGKVKAPLPGAGRVVFFRGSSMLGAAITYKIRTGEGFTTVLGTLSYATYIVVDAPPGTYVFSAATEAKDSVTIEVEEGETYFVEGTMAMGAFVGRPNLAPSNKAAFEKIAKNLKRAKN